MILPSEFELGQLVEPLLQWYYSNRRILPWREDPTPYQVCISEMMLQQTRVEAVKEYYRRVLEELPGISDLAKADEEQLLKLWEGLGYYSRVRNLKKAAQEVETQFHGELPQEYDLLIRLPGIGSYTAGAIASIAYGKKQPAVDGNVLRVITRVSGDESDISKESFKKDMRNRLLSIMPENRAGEFNQALMDLGAMVCLPNGTPLCGQCPWRELCVARQLDKTNIIPVKAKKKERRIEEKTILIVQYEDKILLHKRGEKGLLAGMYEFPSMNDYQNRKQVLAYLNTIGIRSIRMKTGPESKHIFSHIEWHMKSYVIKVDELETEDMVSRKDPNWQFVNRNMIEKAYPIPSAFAAYFPYIVQSGN